MRELIFVACVAACSTPEHTPPPRVPIVGVVGGQAKTFAKTGDGGIVELLGDTDAARDHAEILMAQHCGARSFTVTQDGLEAEDGSGDPCANHFVSRIHYRCGSHGEDEVIAP